ncbi:MULTISPECIES: aldehyde dehydrogenase family protein [Rhodococcus]|uniref:Aldehyde dehydrogenase n=2 Tax=Rhodococcus TaxID=1827 RepID=I0WFC1_RHOOP|nr:MULTISPECIES: aldehyde dehydrogenase family protein [Rhodococcus]EID75087.1 putative aldehyde dehydrogenase [Rhodococcus opacus RKJ300 = JCM 13270]QQZ19161.1 aldehyde dehydrogenase family protein [Rhodococcus sp. 21391]UOT07925.1 aldehyde dehydrogenase family protein [Rhodococcus opacus]
MTEDTRTTAPTVAPSGTFASLDPRSGTVLAEYPIADSVAVAAAVDRARAAARWWHDQGFRGRRTMLLAFKRAVASDADALATLISAETGKPRGDAALEIMLAIEHLDWAARHARKILRRKRVRSGLAAINQSASLGYQPLGVIGVIGPWNFPLYTPMGAISYALAAGNAVVFKPSELTPGVGTWLEQKWNSLDGTRPVLQVVTGLGETGTALARAGVDKIAFTGSGTTARKVMTTCAETLTPLVAECGGKDAMVVAEDADLDKAAEAAAVGAFGNAGQVCAGVERVYVVEPVYHRFLDKLAAAAKRVRPGGDDTATYGPMTLPRQVDIVRDHIADALTRGGTAVVGGVGAVHERYIDPVILTDVPETSTAVREETFGPTVVVNKVGDLDEAVERANATAYGLGASVFTRKRARGTALAHRLRSGAVSVNSVFSYGAIPALPFGGIGESGFGRVHGADGLFEFSRAHALTVERYPAPLKLFALERAERDMRIATWMFRLRHAR